MRIDHIEFTSPGLVREINQDSLFAASTDEYGIFAVADGMGGHSFGEIASGRLTDALAQWWNEFTPKICSFEKCYDDVRRILIDVNESIYNDFTAHGIICGTTAAIVFIYTDMVFFINSGDSRIYSGKGFKVKQESRDHIFGREAIISGNMSKEEVRLSPDRNKLTAAVGSTKELKMYAACLPLNSDRFFICSDGVYKYCKNSVIGAAMRKKSPEKIVSSIVNEKGAYDNYSFIRIRLYKNNHIRTLLNLGNNLMQGLSC